jgi:hypothetical protein
MGHNKRRCPTLQESEQQHEFEIEIVEPDNIVSSEESILQKYFVSSPTFPNDFPLIHTLIQHTTVSIDVLSRHILHAYVRTVSQCPASEGLQDSHPLEEIEYSTGPLI